MEAIVEHALEPELLLPSPRRLRLPWRTTLLLGVAVLLLGVFILASSRALWEGATLLWLEGAGRTVCGKVIAIRTRAASVKGQLPAQTALCYAVLVPGPRGFQHRQEWVTLGAPPPAPGLDEAVPPSVPRFLVGQPFPLRVASLGGITVCQPWGPRPGSRIAALLLAGGLVLAVSLRLLRRLGRWAGSRRFLLRQGRATVGTIMHTRSESEDMMRYFLRYGYPAGPPGGREEQVSADQWRRFQVGQPVTVLYDAQNPSHAGLYALIAQK